MDEPSYRVFRADAWVGGGGRGIRRDSGIL